MLNCKKSGTTQRGQGGYIRKDPIIFGHILLIPFSFVDKSEGGSVQVGVGQTGLVDWSTESDCREGRISILPNPESGNTLSELPIPSCLSPGSIQVGFVFQQRSVAYN